MFHIALSSSYVEMVELEMKKTKSVDPWINSGER
ncbi:hypothetical protein DSM3645_09017 [Blastopirellula marina DSM 3645]|uniref:Uncharacterized protein n=1 Tax=Blastopirellula marina DSM 3645 TaxID=314230 RepID=A3ZL94_9BACT|nr:hypothetical protein DSM3645_09017 [Blastopirellula marina DSM 3645]